MLARLLVLAAVGFGLSAPAALGRFAPAPALGKAVAGSHEARRQPAKGSHEETMIGELEAAASELAGQIDELMGEVPARPGASPAAPNRPGAPGGIDAGSLFDETGDAGGEALAGPAVRATAPRSSR